jgi:hypothetical protein
MSNTLKTDFTMKKYFLPGLKLLKDSNSTKITKVSYTHEKKGKVIIEGVISDDDMERAILAIFNKEREDIKSWSKFLYDLLLKTINSEQILSHNYSEEAYRSWVIKGYNNLEIEFDGRDENLNLLERKPSLRAIVSISSKKITYKNLIETGMKI